MLMIRLQRRGRVNDPSFRVVVVEKSRGPKTGNYLEMVGSYDPRVDRVELNAERITHWLSKGAQASVTVHNLLVAKGVISGKKKNALPGDFLKKTTPAPEAPAAEGVVAPEVPAEGDTQAPAQA